MLDDWLAGWLAGWPAHWLVMLLTDLLICIKCASTHKRLYWASYFVKPAAFSSRLMWTCYKRIVVLCFLLATAAGSGASSKESGTRWTGKRRAAKGNVMENRFLLYFIFLSILKWHIVNGCLFFSACWHVMFNILCIKCIHKQHITDSVLFCQCFPSHIMSDFSFWLSLSLM